MVQATIEGMTFDLDLGEVIDLGIYLQQFEPDVTAAIEQYCKPGWVVLDIGANIGAHTLRFAKIIGSSGRLFAFEATDYAYRKLVKNISLNSFQNTFAFQLALWDQNLEQQEISFRSSWRTDGKLITATSTVDFVRLDEWCAKQDISHVDLIKIDVDGNEFPVLNGGRALLERFRPMLLMEIVGTHFERPLRNPLELLKTLGYRFWDIKSLHEYSNLDNIYKLFPAHDDEMTMSINVIAAPDRPVPNDLEETQL